MEDTRTYEQYKQDTINVLNILEFYLKGQKICKHCDGKYFLDDNDLSKYCSNCLYLWRNNFVQRL